MAELRDFYDRTYEAIFGRHPKLSFFHFQWLAGRVIYKDLKIWLPQLSGRIIDIGCGAKPYEEYLSHCKEHIGIDREISGENNHQIDIEKTWPFADNSFDGALCTEVLEHTKSPQFVIQEALRVTKSGGILIFTVPFIYAAHGVPDDFFRFSLFGMQHLFKNTEIIISKRQGAIGSTVGYLFLRWIFECTHRPNILRPFRFVFLPVFILLSIVVNCLGWIWDRIDFTNDFYSNTMIVVRKK